MNLRQGCRKKRGEKGDASLSPIANGEKKEKLDDYKRGGGGLCSMCDVSESPLPSCIKRGGEGGDFANHTLNEQASGKKGGKEKRKKGRIMSIKKSLDRHAMADIFGCFRGKGAGMG